jgi:hypothetical protein
MIWIYKHKDFAVVRKEMRGDRELRGAAPTLFRYLAKSRR